MLPFEDDEPDGSTIEGLIYLVERQHGVLLSVATGTAIDSENNAIYKRRRRKVKSGLERVGIDDPYPWLDLYEWWNYCAAPRYTTYQERRGFLNSVTEPVLEQLERRKTGVTDWAEDAEPTWPLIVHATRGIEARDPHGEHDRRVARRWKTGPRDHHRRGRFCF